jgi:dienelactone hydrolase
MRSMRRVLMIGIGATLAALSAAFMFREPLFLSYLALNMPKTPLAAREALIEPAIRYYRPAVGAPPYPAVLQFHGCGGMKPSFQEQWAKVANDAGFMAVAVDSYAPRGITRERALKTVCEGKELIGQERAGDVGAALEIARRRKDIDPERIVLAGWSHGAWSVMDFIALETHGKNPAGISDVRPRPLSLAGLFLVYPHCGAGAWTRVSGWKTAYPTLGLIAGKDSIVDAQACARMFGRLAEQDARVAFHIYPDADHGFDDPKLPEGWTHLYDAEDHADAALRYAAFLNSLKD